MAHLIERPNPLQPRSRDVVRLPPGLTVRQALEHVHPGFLEFQHPTLVSLNGRPLMRAQWDTTVVQDGDTLAAAALPSGIETVFYIVMAIVMVATYVMVANMPTPKNPAELPAPDPVFSLSGQRNTMKLMEPIEVVYGRNRLWPSYAARPFNKYQGNEQYLYQLFCIGQGEFEVHGISIEDTDIDSFQNVTYELVPPGGSVTLFPDNVVTSVEVNRLELFGPNEEQYVVYGPFTLTAPFTETDLVEVDVTLPQGLYHSNGDGGLSNITASALFEVRLIDDNGAPAGAWQTLASFTRTMNTVNPQRFTLSTAVALGRYDIRARRTNDTSTSYRDGDTLMWEAARAFLPNARDYGNVTMLAVVAQASNNLNDNSSSRINVDCTRKLPVRQNGVWVGPVPTRSIAWAFYDVFASAYGGQLESQFIDLDELERLDAVWEGRQEYFNFVFNQKTTVWEAAKAVARVGRAVPTVNGSFISLVRDEVQAVPMGVFGIDNIMPDSFKWEVKLFDPKEHDSVQVTYVNRTSGLQETVTCLPPGSPGLNPNKITFAGCNDRDHAYREGMYIAMSDRLLRENVTFRTGLEGYIPSYGDMVVVSYPLPKWGTSGHVVAASDDMLELELSEPVEFSDGQHYLMLRRDDGTGDGPYLVVEGQSEFHVRLATPLGGAYPFGEVGREPVLFAFGHGDDWSRRCRVVEINPSGDEAVEVTCVNYDPAVSQFDETAAPPLASVPVPPAIPDRPTVPFLTVSRVPNALGYIVVSWGPALGATSYVLQQSSDGVNWTMVTQTTAVSYQLNVVKGALWLRVAGRGKALGNWATWDGEVGSPVGVPLGVRNLQLQQPFAGTFAKVQWASLVDADAYRVRVYSDGGATLLRTSLVSGIEFTYTSEMMQLDGTPARSLRFMVYGVNEFGDSASAAQLDVTNSVPTQMTSGFSREVKVETADTAVYTLNWLPNGDPDVRAYRVWGSLSSGFAVDDTNKKFDGMAYQCDVTLSKVPHVVSVTGVSKASPGVVGYTGPALTNGQKVAVSGVGGMTQLNGGTYVVRGATAGSFQLYQEVQDTSEYGYGTVEQPVDTTYFGTYTSGGQAAVTPTALLRPALYWRVAAVDVWGSEVNPSAQQTAS